MSEEPSLNALLERLAEIEADVAAHDDALMEMIRRNSRDGTAGVVELSRIDGVRKLELLDRAAEVMERLGTSQRRLFDGVIRSTLERRRLITMMLSLPDSEREAIAFVLALDESERDELDRLLESQQHEGGGHDD